MPGASRTVTRSASAPSRYTVASAAGPRGPSAPRMRSRRDSFSSVSPRPSRISPAPSSSTSEKPARGSTWISDSLRRDCRRRRAAPAPREKPPRDAGRSAAYCSRVTPVITGSPSASSKRRALERAAVLVEQVERAHAARCRPPAARSPRWPAPTAARAGRARSDPGVRRQPRGDAVRIDRQQAIADLARRPAPRSPRPARARSRRLRISRTANRGDAITWRTSCRPASTDSATIADHHQHLARHQQLAADPARAAPPAAPAREALANCDAPVAPPLEPAAVRRRPVDDDAPGRVVAVERTLRTRRAHAQRLRLRSSVSSSVGTPVMSPAPRHSTRSPGRAASASAAVSRSRVDVAHAVPSGNVASSAAGVDARDRAARRRRRCR